MIFTPAEGFSYHSPGFPPQDRRISMRRFRAFGLVMLALCCSRSEVLLGADLPTAEAVLKIHSENKAKLSQLHLQCVHHFETTEAHCRSAQKRADEKERMFTLIRAAKPEERTLKVDGKPAEGAEEKRLLEYLSGAEAEREIKRLRMQQPHGILRPWRRIPGAHANAASQR
jgi:hypothetical protein